MRNKIITKCALCVYEVILILRNRNCANMKLFLVSKLPFLSAAVVRMRWNDVGIGFSGTDDRGLLTIEACNVC